METAAMVLEGMGSNFDTDEGIQTSHLTLEPPLDPPTRHDWERFRFAITYRYLGLNMSLNDLVRHMNYRYGFRASPRMYKQRFTEWQVFKYQRAAKKHLLKVPSSQNTGATLHDAGVVMSRVASNVSSASVPSIHDSEIDDLQCLRLGFEGPCGQPSMCTHRSCIQDFLSRLETHYRRRQTGCIADTSWSFAADSIKPTGCVEEVLFYVKQFSHSWSMPGAAHRHQIEDAAQQAARITSGITGHCSHKASPHQCERCTWAEFDFGLAMLEEGQPVYAFSSFELGCRLAHLLLSSPSKLFIRNLVMAFGSPRWEKFEPIRGQLLAYLALMASTVLGDRHPITLILNNVACGNTLTASAEFALKIITDIFEGSTHAAQPDVLLVKRSLSIILRRQQEYEVSERILLAAVSDSEKSNGYLHKETRRCLRRLAHLYMEQHRWSEAESVFYRILDSAPGKQEYQDEWIPDEISLYTYQHLARLNQQVGDLAKCRFWFSKELIAAIKRWGPFGDYTEECLQAAYNNAASDSLQAAVEQYPKILERAEELNFGGRVIISKARWCAVRNLC